MPMSTDWIRRAMGIVCAAALGISLAASIQVVAQTTPPEGHANLPGVRLYTDTGGGGTPVIFVHAATGSSRVWEYQLPAFTASGYRVITYDRRGQGGPPSIHRARSPEREPTICWHS